jgi:hypothetical protein
MNRNHPSLLLATTLLSLIVLAPTARTQSEPDISAKTQGAAASGSAKSVDGGYSVLKKGSKRLERQPEPQANAGQQLPQLPASAIPTGRATPAREPAPSTGNPGTVESGVASRQTGGNGQSQDLVQDVLARSGGQARVNSLLQQLGTMTGEPGGRGAPTAHVVYDNALPGNGDDSQSHPAGTPVFEGTFRPMPVDAAHSTSALYGGIPGGVVLEGSGPDLSAVQQIGYDSRYNAVILDNRSVYVLKVSPELAALLFRAIGGDDKERVGVSAAQPPIVYGAVPDDSMIAWDLLLADEFLGGIVFANSEYTNGYRFASDFVPRKQTSLTYNVAVFFKFTNFQFAVRNDEWHGTGGTLDIQLVPLSDKRASDGNFLPDDDAIRAGKMYAAFTTNATHIAQNLSYYRRELIVSQMFAYGETAAFIRALKRAGFDLATFASAIGP